MMLCLPITPKKEKILHEWSSRQSRRRRYACGSVKVTRKINVSVFTLLNHGINSFVTEWKLQVNV
jgi:hypothetical protein